MPTTSSPHSPSAAGQPEAPVDPSVDGAADACGCGDPHHDHGITGADIVQQLIRGFSILSLVVPVLGLALIGAALLWTPSTPLVALIGLSLGGLQLVGLIVSSLVVARGGRTFTLSPGLLAVRSAIDEVLRLAAVLFALVLWPAEPRGPLGLWIGVGCALVWIVLTTLQLISARRRIASPSEWSKTMVATLLTEKVSVRRTLVMRVVDVIALILFQIGATILVMLAPVMVIATAVLSIATGLSTLVLQRRPSSHRITSPWALAPLVIGVITAALAAFGAAAAL